MISGIGVILGIWLTFEDYLDLVSTRWNVEGDILLRGEFVTPRKTERRRNAGDQCPVRIWSEIRPVFGRIPGRIGLWFWKKLISSLAWIRPDSRWIVTWQSGSQLWPAVFLHSYLAFWLKYLHFCFLAWPAILRTENFWFYSRIVPLFEMCIVI